MTDMPFRFSKNFNAALRKIETTLDISINEDDLDVYMWPQTWKDSSLGDESAEVFLPTLTRCVCTAIQYDKLAAVFMDTNLVYFLNLDNEDEERFFMESIKYGGFDDSAAPR